MGQLMESNGIEAATYCGGTADDWHREFERLRGLVDDMAHELCISKGEAKTQRNNFEQASAARTVWEHKLENLVACLEHDYGIKAEWDGLRKVWVTERSKPECTECAEGLARYADGQCDTLKTDLRCMTFERDFWRDEVKRLRELVDSLSRKLGDDEGMA